jgi:hypothetical protein
MYGVLWGICSPHKEHFDETGILFSSYFICNSGERNGILEIVVLCPRVRSSPTTRSSAMAKVTKNSGGYEFAGLSAIGVRLVNEFQRYHPELCMPSSDMSYRFIRQGSLEQNLELGKLVAKVRAEDPEPTPPTFNSRP